MSEFITNAQAFLEKNPEYGYLIAAAILLIFAIGNFLNFKWATSAGSEKQRSWLSRMGERKFRYFMGTVFLIGTLGCVAAFYLST